MNDIESKLKRLVPNASAVDRDALLHSAAYAAGRAAGRKPWMRLSAVFASAMVVLSCVWMFSNRLPALPPHAVTPAVAPATAAPVQPDPYRPEPTSYIALMQHMGEYAPTSSGGSTAEQRPPLTPRSRFE